MARRNWQYLLLFLAHLSLSLAASPTLFCKCTCFSNSTIIPLNQPQIPPNNPSDPVDPPQQKTCNDCTRKFCLDYNLPICAEATEADVVTKCFQRESTKDEAIVLLFIFTTVGLLAWAVVKPWVIKWRSGGGIGSRASYIPVSGPG